ncbi:GTPase activating protein [Blyttiomyces sp. JEL0837]|nr:GTPase activating protein [Blyttiomyces sp. JEL0837]
MSSSSTSPTGNHPQQNLLGDPYDVLLDSSPDPLVLAVKETQWSVLERFSRVTRLYKDTAAHLLTHPLAKPILPYVPKALHPSHPIPQSQSQQSNQQQSNGIFAFVDSFDHEYEPARVYLARWAHEMQVARGRESEFDGSNGNVAGGGGVGKKEGLVGSTSVGTGGGVGAGSGRLRMLKEETLGVENSGQMIMNSKNAGMGSFDMSSTDSLSSDPQQQPSSRRQRPLSSKEWSLYFDVYRPLPKAKRVPIQTITSMTSSIVHVSIEDEEEDDKELEDAVVASDGEGVVGVGKIVVPVEEGIDSSIRGEVWRFEFGLYPWNSTTRQRKAIKVAKTEEYWRLKREWLEIAESIGEGVDLENVSTNTTGFTDAEFASYRDAVTRVDKDILRTDRQHPFYQPTPSELSTPPPEHRPPGVGPGSKNLNILRDVLITYSCRYSGNDGLGYVQGMSDLASPFVVVTEGDEREFGFDDVCRMWEVVGAFNGIVGSGFFGGVGQSEYPEFFYFVALAILDEHRDSILRCLVNFDEVLKYINDLSGTVPLDPILEAAELLYIRFRNRAVAVGAWPLGDDNRDMEKDVLDDGEEGDAEVVELIEGGVRFRGEGKESGKGKGKETVVGEKMRLLEVLERMLEIEDAVGKENGKEGNLASSAKKGR